MAQVPATQTNQGGRLATRRAHPLERLHRDFEILFNRLGGTWLAPFDQDFGSMRVWDFDVTENDREIVVRAEMPGFEENELDVQINQNVLTIKAEKEQKKDGQEAYRSFYRSITLPPGLNADKVQATYRNGVLELHIPRAEGAQPKHIKVEGQQAPNGLQGQQAPPTKAGAATSQTANSGQEGKDQTAATASAKAKK
jgi:HSP20 family protein